MKIERLKDQTIEEILHYYDAIIVKFNESDLILKIEVTPEGANDFSLQMELSDG